MRDISPESFQRAKAELRSELQASWQFLADLSDQLSQSALGLRDASKFSGTLRETHTWYEERSGELLADPIRQFLKVRPIERSLNARQACDREVPIKSIRSRRRIDDAFQRLLVRSALDLCEPWRIWRGGSHELEWNAWEQRRARHSRDAQAILERYDRWAARIPTTDAGSEETLSEEHVHDSRQQQRAVTATLEMEVAFRDLTLSWFEATEHLSSEIRQERAAIQSNAVAMLHWLEENGAEPSDAPSPISVDERMRAWASPLEDQGAQWLPEQAEVLLSGLRTRRRPIDAHARFLATFETYARAPMRTLVEHSWAVSAGIVREVWQAKEIVAYWQASPETSSEASQLMTEARHNAIVILREESQPTADLEQLDARTVECFWGWHEKGSIAFEAEQFGWLNLLRRPRGRAVINTASEHGQLRAKASAQRLGRWASGHVDRALEVIGGKVPAQPTLRPVVRRITLRDTLSLPAGKTSLPILYSLLFRLSPVEDRRFLLGRDQELAGLKQATEDWESGRFAACLMIGARGSGKTSLLNCAAADIFAGREMIRAEFDDRILSPDQLNTFLRKLLDLNTEDNLESSFRNGRRIVILEESERIYLRKVGGFGAAHHLMHFIHRTASSTLWIIVMNDKSFRVLNAATGLHRVFSHRINAMNVSRCDLENAILERHRLSGMKLKFAPPPAGDPRVNRVKQWIGLEESAQKLYFDSLFQQSEGIFRSAFELWLSSIQSAEGETLTIRQPLDPSFGHFRSELAQEDQITLLVIQEHGSLTQEELTEVLCETYNVSGSRMERLTALGLIEPDPAHPGLRVRPEAQRFVNDLLRRTNLT